MLAKDDYRTDTASARDRILVAAERLVAETGVEGATTRAIADMAGVQAPTIYRLFGDKVALLDAVAEKTLSSYVASKADRDRHPDPVEELRGGWDRQVAFALAHPGIFAIMAAQSETARDSPAYRAGIAILRKKLQAVGTAGRLKIPEDRALHLFHGSATGITATLLRQPPEKRDMALSAAARDAAIAAIVGAAPADGGNGVRDAANALKAALPHIESLSAGESLLLAELLDRIASA
ncbi:TetR/AcrR family transcriptional regulator [Kushneria aurantia]|uniref:TetR/AcrR family transcriptional regulator n=1 Tax=Kushneria aurantia TaxID=504092 RepID=A0ABV6FZW0_9GAMM|nr:TetR/AcrR family transcriptional regulator [Kushneria aurantia]